MASVRSSGENDNLKSLLEKLRPFQREGFKFATKACIEENNRSGGRILLADEMVS